MRIIWLMNCLFVCKMNEVPFEIFHLALVTTKGKKMKKLLFSLCSFLVFAASCTRNPDETKMQSTTGSSTEQTSPTHTQSNHPTHTPQPTPAR